MDALKSIVITAKKEQLKERIEELKSLLAQYQNKIEYYQQQIQGNDKAYESLISFKAHIMKSRESFTEISNSKNSVLEQVQSVSNNIVAQKYYVGMKRILSGTGAEISNNLFTYLINRTQTEMNSLKNKAEECSDKIDYYKRLIRTAQEEIVALDIELQELEQEI